MQVVIPTRSIFNGFAVSRELDEAFSPNTRHCLPRRTTDCGTGNPPHLRDYRTALDVRSRDHGTVPDSAQAGSRLRPPQPCHGMSGASGCDVTPYRIGYLQTIVSLTAETCCSPFVLYLKSQVRTMMRKGHTVQMV